MSNKAKELLLSSTLVQSSMLRTRYLSRQRPAPSVFSLPGLSSPSPNWTPYYAKHHEGLIQKLEDSFGEILQEYRSFEGGGSSQSQGSGSDYTDDHKNLLHTGSWDWRSYVLKGKRQESFAKKCPKTVDVLESLSMPFNSNVKGLMTGTPLSYAFFSTMGAGAVIEPHFGPTNLRIRCHFPLIVPPGDLGMKVGGEVIHWEVGKPLLFDDAYEHQVWNHSDGDRVILLFDLWHPELQEDEIVAIKAMFSFAETQGWSSK